MTTWEYHKADDPDSRCDAGSDGYGDQTIKFDAKRKFKLNFIAPPRNRPNIFPPRAGPRSSARRSISRSTRRKLEGIAYKWPGADGSNSASTLDDSYRKCPLLLDGSYVERAGNVWTSGAHLSEKTLFDTKRKKLVVSGHTIQKFHSGDSTGQTILAWNLRLTRVK